MFPGLSDLLNSRRSQKNFAVNYEAKIFCERRFGSNERLRNALPLKLDMCFAGISLSLSQIYRESLMP